MWFFSSRHAHCWEKVAQVTSLRRKVMKILMPVDGSDCSKVAVASVASRPWPAGSVVKVLSAVELPYAPTSEMWTIPDNYYAQLEAAAQDAAAQAVEEAAEVLEGQGLEVVTATGSGSAREVILAEARQWGADLIVLGSHGYSGWQRFWLGSVSQAVLTHAHCSVEIVRKCKEHAQ
jgi:nucleotide-binding universal stress UspA family protein